MVLEQRFLRISLDILVHQNILRYLEKSWDHRIPVIVLTSGILHCSVKILKFLEISWVHNPVIIPASCRNFIWNVKIMRYFGNSWDHNCKHYPDVRHISLNYKMHFGVDSSHSLHTKKHNNKESWSNLFCDQMSSPQQLQSISHYFVNSCYCYIWMYFCYKTCKIRMW